MITEEALAAIVRRAQAGDEAALAMLVRAFLRAAYATALSIVGRPADAEDVAQDTFVVALEKIGTCREPERFAGWLLQIVRHRALNWIDRRRLRDVAPDAADHLSTSSSPIGPNASEPAICKERLIRALGEISPVSREVLLLHDLEEWTHAEIGVALGVSEVMSRQHLFNARRALRELLGADRPAEVGHART